MQLRTGFFSAVMAATISATPLTSTANEREIPDHFYDRYGSDKKDVSKPEMGKMERLFTEGTVLSKKAGDAEISLKIKRKSVGVEWKLEF